MKISNIFNAHVRTSLRGRPVEKKHKHFINKKHVDVPLKKNINISLTKNTWASR
jgi:hypothetical protein